METSLVIPKQFELSGSIAKHGKKKVLSFLDGYDLPLLNNQTITDTGYVQFSNDNMKDIMIWLFGIDDVFAEFSTVKDFEQNKPIRDERVAYLKEYYQLDKDDEPVEVKKETKTKSAQPDNTDDLNTALFFLNKGCHHTQIFDDIRNTWAYRCLTFAEKAVLMDMMRVYNTVCFNEPKRGFVYSWSHCEEVISKRAFYKSIEKIIEVGFFSQKKSNKLGNPTIYFKSGKWKTWQPDDEKIKTEILQYFEEKSKDVAKDRKKIGRN